MTCPILVSHIETVLSKLIDNAIKFSSSDSSVVITGHGDGPKLRFSVADTGCGVPPEAIASMYEKFFQANRETMEQQGSGLGLYIVKRLTERYGGTVRCESDAGRGTVFHIELPVIGP